MKEQPGYPLPAGELGNDDIVCQLVFLPDRPEYWQAFISALHYFATWRAWERDDDKRGKDAASNWSQANELTMECWRMACLQNLQDNVAEILAIMQLGNQCCDDQDITGGDRYTDRVADGVDDVPQPIIDAGYASDVDDWAGFDDYKCMIVHVTVNQMEARLRELAVVVDSAGPYLAVAAALSAILGVIVATGGLAIVFGIVAGIGVVSALYFALLEFESIDGLADDVATNHDELACAMYNSDGDDGALAALNDKIDELFSVAEAGILKNLNNGPTLKALYAGRYDQQDIANELLDAGYELGDFTCNCIEIDLNGWTEVGEDIDLYDDDFAQPNCTTFNIGTWNDFTKPDGPNHWGDVRIQGNVRITGTMGENTNCIDTGQLWVQVRIRTSDDSSFSHIAGGGEIRFFTQEGGLAGAVDLLLPFDETWAIGNAYTVSLNTHSNWRYGDIDIVTTTEVHTFEVT